MIDVFKRVAAEQRHVAKALDGGETRIISECHSNRADALRLIAALGFARAAADLLIGRANVGERKER